MSDALLSLLFSAIVQMESGGNLKAVNGSTFEAEALDKSRA
jgi:hypothetical protein